MNDDELRQITVKLPTPIYKEFRKKCVDEETTMNDEVNRMVQEYVGE